MKIKSSLIETIGNLVEAIENCPNGIKISFGEKAYVGIMDCLFAIHYESLDYQEKKEYLETVIQMNNE